MISDVTFKRDVCIFKRIKKKKKKKKIRKNMKKKTKI